VSINRFGSIASLFALLLLIAAPVSGQQTLAVRGGTLLTGTGQTIEGGTVIIRDGKIVAVGAEVDIPVDARVIDATDKVVMPGFVEAHSSEGMSQANETNPNVPYVSVMDSIDPSRPYFDEARRNGVTCVAVVPGNSTMIGGQAAVLKTGGEFVEDMVLKRDAGIKISLQPIGSASRMGHLAALRKALQDARDDGAGNSDESEDADDDEEDDDDDEGEGEEEDDEAESGRERGRDLDDASRAELNKAMKLLVSGQIPAIIYCDRAMDVPQALALIEEFGLQPVLVLGKDCYKAAKLVAESGFPVILDDELVFRESDERTAEDRKVVLPQVFREQGVNFAFQTARGSQDTLGRNYLWYQAATAVKYGMPRDEALRSLTLLPATILGVDQFVGSLETGKDGDLVILSGDPLNVDTWVETTIVNGQVVYEKQTDQTLKRLLGTAGDTDADMNRDN
jgi:imidazolonepropionase-like amidohydrolase